MVLMWMLVNQRRAIYCWVGVADLVWDCLEGRCGSYWFLNHFLIEFISQFSELRCGRYWVLSGWILFIGNSIKLQKLSLEGKSSWALNVFTWPNLQNFNSENVKNKECVHIWVKGVLFQQCLVHVLVFFLNFYLLYFIFLCVFCFYYYFL